MWLLRILSFIFILVMTQTPIMSQEKKSFTLEDLLPGGTTYNQNRPERRYYTLWGDKCIEQNQDDLNIINTTTGSPELLVSLSDINKTLAENHCGIIMKSLDKATFPYDNQTLVMLKHDNERLLVDWEAGKVVWKSSIDSKGENVDWNAESRNTAYTKDHNLYILTAEGDLRQLSEDGSIDLVYGETVHRNEFGINKGTFWSPTGDKLAFYKMDQSMVSTYPQVDISTRCATMVPDKYPMAGEASHKVYVGIYDVKKATTVYLQTGDPTDRYFTNICWSPDEKTIYMIELNRDQNHSQLIAYNASTGEKEKLLFEETDEKYVEPLTPITFLPWDKDKFIYQSRKDGYNHIYLYGKDGKQIRQLTKGKWEVQDFLGFNEKTKRIVYTSNESNPIQCNTYTVDTKGKRRQIGDNSGWHNPVLSHSGNVIIDKYSSPEVTSKTDLVDVSTGVAKNLHNAPDPWSAFKVPEIRVGTIKAADGMTDLYYRMVLPTDFDPTKKYPAIIYVYGGPHEHLIEASRNWDARPWDIWMAQKGYVMFTLDNRGSERRGKDFEQCTFRQLGVEEMKDQLCGVDFLKSKPYVDESRIGVHGWSFGGFMTTSLMTTYPDVFKVGVAGGPVIDWKYYEVMYGERYMDTPQSNPEGYEKTSLLNKAKNLKGHLMIIYGGNDNVCVPQHTLSFIRACIDNGTYPDLFTYPGDQHNMYGRDRIHLHEKISRYFDDYLK